MNKWQCLRKYTGSGAAAALILCGILYCVASWQLSLAEGYYGGLTQLRMDRIPASANQIEELVQESREEVKRQESGGKESIQRGSIRYTAWTQKKDIVLKNPEVNRSVEADVIYYCGDESPRFHLILDNGCAVSEETAFTLWGTAEGGEVLGSSVRIGAKDYIVEQIISSKTPANKWSGGTVIAHWKEKTTGSSEVGAGNRIQGQEPETEEQMQFDVLDISHERGEKAPVTTIIMSGNLNSDLELYYDEQIGMVSVLRKLPLWGIAIYLSVHLILKGRMKVRTEEDMTGEGKVRAKIFQYISLVKTEKGGWFTAVGLAIPAAAGLLLGAPFAVPQSFIPTRWSDFDFWSKRASEAGETLQSMLTMGLYGPDAWFRALFVSSLLLSLLQTVLLVIICHNLIRGTFRKKGSS